MDFGLWEWLKFILFFLPFNHPLDQNGGGRPPQAFEIFQVSELPEKLNV
jgi:hypothetical protein